MVSLLEQFVWLACNNNKKCFGVSDPPEAETLSTTNDEARVTNRIEVGGTIVSRILFSWHFCKSVSLFLKVFSLRIVKVFRFDMLAG